MAADTTRLNIELVTLLRGLNQTLRGLDQVKRKLESVASVKFNQRSTTNATDRQVLAAQRLALAQQRLQLQQQRLGVSTQELANRQERARQTAERLARSNDRLTQSSVRQSRVLPQLQQRINSLGAAALRVGGSLRSLGATASIVLTGPLVALGTLATRNAVEFDSLRRGLEVMAGSSQEAAKQLERLKEIAKAPGIGFQEAIQGSVRLQAVGFSALDAEKALVQFANAIALTGGGREELERVTVQLGQLAAKGKVVAQDLKPIIEAAPAVGQALLNAFGTVNSEDIQKLGLTTNEFFDRLTGALEKLPRAAAGAKNSFENFSDSVFRASLALGEAIIPVLNRLINFFEPIILKVSEAFRNLPEAIQVAIIAVGVFAAALGPILFLVGGISSGLGALATAAAALVPILGSIGLPAILAILATLGIVITEITAVVAALGLAWKTNFLGVRELVTNAASAVLSAFTRIRSVLDEATRRILPTLQSITTKVLGVVSAAWERYGKTVVVIVSEAFKVIVDFTERVVRTFADFVDLILKLIDGDWKGAWQAFSRIVIGAIDNLPQLFVRLQLIVARALLTLVNVINAAALQFAVAAQRLAITFTTELAVKLISEAQVITTALEEMLLNAALSVNVTSIAALLVARLISAMREAAAKVAPAALAAQNVGIDVGFEGFAKAGRRFLRASSDADSKAQRQLARQENRLREAQDRLAEQSAENRITTLRTAIEQQFALTKDGLDREQRALENNFEDRLVAVKKFFVERKRLQETEIDAELVKEKGLSGALFDEWSERRRQIEKEFQTAIAEVEGDKRLKGRARDLALQTAEINKQTALAKAQSEFETQNADISTRILTLQKAREDVGKEVLRDEANLTRELRLQHDQLRFDLAEEQGRTADAAVGRLKARFTETLRDLRVDLSGLGEDLQKAITDVDLSTLQQQLDQLPDPVRTLVELLDIGVKRAQIAELQQFVDNLQSGLQIDTARIQNRVLDGLISQREAQAELVALQREYRAVLLDVLQGELAKAEAIKDQEQILAIQSQIQEVERLGVAIDEVGQQINQRLFADVESGISGIFSGARRGLDGLKEAAISFGERLLDTLNDIAASSIMKQLEDLFKPDATNTQGTIGGFFSKLFGLAPKQQADAAAASATLQAGAATASATLTTGVTAAGTGFSASMLTAATSFASLIISAGAAFAAAVGASSAAQSIGGLGSALGAATGLFPAVPGGVVRIVEGGFPEAVLTTDPKHAVRQVAILRAFLRETRGLGGRIRGLAAGGFAMPDLALNIPGVSIPSTNFSNLEIGPSQQATNLRILNLLDKRQLVGGHLRTAEGAHDILNVISENSEEIGRRLRIR